jgi:hypothetical protein
MHRLVLVATVLAACSPAADLDLDLSQSEVIPTVFTASVTGEASGLEAAWLELGLDGDFDRRIALDLDAGPPWELPLLGLKPGADYEVRLAVQLDGEVYSGRSHGAATGMVPAAFTDISQERVEGESYEGFLVTSILGDASAAVILDADGAFVWWYQPDGVDMVGRTFISRDGSSIYTMELNPNGGQAGRVVRVSLDGASAESWSVDYAHHDLFEHEDGTLAMLAKDPASVGGTEVTGDSIVELGPDGTTTTIWSIWDSPDALPYEASDVDRPGEWPHANALEYLPDEDAYLVGFLYLDAIARVDRASGVVDWVMGGDHSDFAFTDGGTDLFERTHQMQWLDDSLLVFVNGSPQGGDSYAVEYAVDEESFEVDPVWEYWTQPSVSCISLGDVHRFDGGNTMITYSYSGLIEEVTPEGEPVRTLSTSAGGVIGYVTPVDDLDDL